MMWDLSFVFLLFFMKNVYSSDDELRTAVEQPVLNASAYVFWPNATVPFYIDGSNFDPDQFTTIMRGLSYFADKTCIKFRPLLTPPKDGDHVMMFINPKGMRKCVFNTDGHYIDEVHQIIMGYDCMKLENQVHMMIMKSLGFGFEHNRPVRDLFIEIQPENIEPGHLELFTKDNRIPVELHPLPYDQNSVTHFGERDYSKNGHKTIRFRNLKSHQHRVGLSPMDVRKIQIVYGPECLKRERQEKKEICQSYPGVARKKRSAQHDNTAGKNIALRRKRDVESVTNLRVNRDITPGPNDIQESLITNDILKELDVENDIEAIVDSIYKLNAVALEKAREKFCNSSKPVENKEQGKIENQNGIDGVVYNIAAYTKSVVDLALRNLTIFCDVSAPAEKFLRAACAFYKGRERCPQTYRSTKSGDVRHSTQHWPTFVPSTKHSGNPIKHHYIPFHRSGVETVEKGKSRRKREEDGSKIRRFEKQTYKKNRHSKDWSQSEISKETPTKKEHSEKERKAREKESSEEQESNVPKTVKLSKGNKEFYNDRKWFGGVVRYLIDDLPTYDIEDLRRRLREVNSILAEKTCVRIEEIGPSDKKRYEDYIILDNSPDYVTGRVGGEQRFGSIELFQGGQHHQHTAMMVMAMLGFYFEVSRHDRDKHIRVHVRHVRADKLHHFEKIREDSTLDLPYDYKSATHPAWQFWRKIGKTGISTVATFKDKDPDGSVMKSLGQNEPILSDLDIVKINSVYGVKCFQRQERKKSKRKQKAKASRDEEKAEEQKNFKREKNENYSSGSQSSS